MTILKYNQAFLGLVQVQVSCHNFISWIGRLFSPKKITPSLVQLLVLEILASTGAQENHFLDHVGTLNQGFIYHYWVLALKRCQLSNTNLNPPFNKDINFSTCFNMFSQKNKLPKRKNREIHLTIANFLLAKFCQKMKFRTQNDVILEIFNCDK